MIQRLRKYFNKKVIAVKGEIKLNFIYPKKFSKSSIKSILPLTIETLIKEDVIIDKDVTISSHLKNIGPGVYIGWNTSITQCMSIGAFTSISNGVKIGLANHALDHIGTSPLFYAKRRGWVANDTFVEEDGSFVEIGSDVLISANVIVLKNIKIGHGAVIGAGSVVTKDVPPYAIVAGVPAKLIKYRFDETTIAKLLESEWWKMPIEKIKASRKVFNDINAFLNEIKK